MKAFFYLIVIFLISSEVHGAALFSPRRPMRRKTPIKQNTYEGGYSGTCNITNPDCVKSSKVRVDVSAKCMCIGFDCFKVSIGAGGPGWTRNGTSRIGLTSGIFDRNSRGAGGIYETKSTTTNAYDNDALAMGIPSNDAVGKWFHKTAGCVKPERYQTAGCVAVPCEKWAKLKSEIGSEVTICGGRGSGGLFSRPPRPSLSGIIDQVTENAAYVDSVQEGAVQ